jgi:hypothetical protein
VKEGGEGVRRGREGCETWICEPRKVSELGMRHPARVCNLWFRVWGFGIWWLGVKRQGLACSRV